MASLLFVGRKDRGYPLEEVAESNNIEVKYMKPSPHIQDMVSDIIEENSEWVVYDISEFIDEPEDVASAIKAICNTINSKVIIYAIGHNLMSLGIRACIDKGFKNFVLTYAYDKRKEEIRKCLNGFYEANEPEFINIIKEEIKDTRHEYQTIAVAGCCSRIGTTTQAIQIVKYFLLMGHKVCYIQMSDSDYAEKIVRYYIDVDVNQDLGKATYCSVDMYFDLNRLPDILNMDYEYYVYDFGVFNQGSFNKVSFLEKNHKIVVGGAKVNELGSITNVLQETYLTDVKYIFSFIEDNSETRKDILELMDEKAKDTFFAPYAPEPFKLTSDYGTYEDLFPCENLNAVVEEKPKKWPGISFPFKKKKGVDMNEV